MGIKRHNVVGAEAATEEPKEVKTTATTTSKDTAKATVEAQIPVQETNEEIIESKCDKIAFVAALGDPSRDDITPADENKGIERRIDPTIVGFAFKVLEDMEIPDCGTQDDLKENNMSYANINGKRMAKAGEVVYLTRFETGMLLSPEEFNGKATGGELPVVVTYQSSGAASKKGTTATVSEATKVPSVALRPLKKGSSIKDIEMIPVLDFTSEKLPNGKTRKKRTIRPGFEKWAPLCKERIPGSGSKREAVKKTTRSKGAEAFLAIVAAKSK